MDKSINVDKSGKCYYIRFFKIDLDQITNFIYNLEDNEIYLINPRIFIRSTYIDLYLCLSRQFLVSNKSNPLLIFNYLNIQLEKAKFEFGIEFNNGFNLIFKYKKVSIDYRIKG